MPRVIEMLKELVTLASGRYCLMDGVFGCYELKYNTKAFLFEFEADAVAIAALVGAHGGLVVEDGPVEN